MKWASKEETIMSSPNPQEPERKDSPNQPPFKPGRDDQERDPQRRGPDREDPRETPRVQKGQ